MVFRQLFDEASHSYSYLLAAKGGGEALLIDPVLEHTEAYLRLLQELDLKLVVALDTHTHADHITALGALRTATQCRTLMGSASRAECVSARLGDGEVLKAAGLALTARHTPGHTDDSCCYLLPDRVFTGDTLLIRGTGRTDFQNGDARAAWHSLQAVLLRLPDATCVYPGHDYKGWTVSTIGEERRHNPRLQVRDAEAYAALMASLKLPHPKLMDVAVPANLACGSSPPGG